MVDDTEAQNERVYDNSSLYSNAKMRAADFISHYFMTYFQRLCFTTVSGVL